MNTQPHGNGFKYQTEISTRSYRCPVDFIKWVAFEAGAEFYARKLEAGPETDLRTEFARDLIEPYLSTLVRKPVLLDVGCGPGHVARYFALQGCSVTGIDRGKRFSQIIPRLSQQKEIAIEFTRASSHLLPFADDSFDCSYATGVIYWIARPQETIAEMVRVTKCGGIIASMDPHASMTVSAIRKYARRHGLSSADRRKLVEWAISARCNRRFTEEKLRLLYENAGLEDIVLERRMDGMVWFCRGVVVSVAPKDLETIRAETTS